MDVVSVNVRFGGQNIAERAARIAQNVKSHVPSFASALFFVQECSAPAMRAIRSEVGDTHFAFARPNYRTHIGPFVATFVPRTLIRDRRVAVAWRKAPYTKMWRDYHAVSVAITETEESKEKEEEENGTQEEKETPKKTVLVVEVYNVHLDSCKENRETRKAQVRYIARQSSGPFAILGDLNERVKLVSSGIDARTVATWRVRGTDHKARLYRLTTTL
jgi:endonuclease/exonuclease/phosphatase family metal-dependent hydrolase